MVFIGLAIQASGMEYKFRAERILLGEVTTEVKVTTGLPFRDCAPRFKVGETYVVYATGYHARLIATICHRTRLLREADEDLAFFDGLDEGLAEQRER